MAYKFRIKEPSLRDLIEIQESSAYSLYSVPFGKVRNLGMKVVKKAVPWKKVKGEAYKKIKTKTGENLYDKQQRAAGVVREKARGEGYGGRGRGVAVVRYASGEYGIVPIWSAGLGMTGKKGKIVEVVSEHLSKEAAMKRLFELEPRLLEQLAIA